MSGSLVASARWRGMVSTASTDFPSLALYRIVETVFSGVSAITLLTQPRRRKSPLRVRKRSKRPASRVLETCAMIVSRAWS
jgi:hypothetical protein